MGMGDDGDFDCEFLWMTDGDDGDDDWDDDDDDDDDDDSGGGGGGDDDDDGDDGNADGCDHGDGTCKDHLLVLYMLC